MSEHLSTVADYFESIRMVLQDTLQPYRYADTDILVGFNSMFMEARRLRPDLFVTRWGNKVPHFESNDSTPVDVDQQFRLGFVYGSSAYVLTFDQEDVNDARANTFYNTFHVILTGVMPPQIQGGTPPAGSPQK